MQIPKVLLLFLIYGVGLYSLGAWALDAMGIKLPGIDDAYIFFVYARNFAEGHGFVYNVGGERVEGFSSFLWGLVLSGSWKLLGGFGWGMMAICVGICSAYLVLGVRVFQHLLSLKDEGMGASSADWNWIAALWVGVWAMASPGFVIWSCVTLMENCLWELLLIGCVLWVLILVPKRMVPIKVYAGLGALLGALTWCRPEGIYWCCLLLLGLGLGRFCCVRKGKEIIREVLVSGVVCGAMFGALVAFRLSYFGYPFPNTYYAKVSPDRIFNFIEGVKYIIRFGMWHWGVPFCCVFVLLGFLNGLKMILERFTKGSVTHAGEVAMGVLCAWITGGFIVAVLVGGDHFDFFRIFQVFWVLLPLPLFVFLMKQFQKSEGLKKGGILVAGILLGIACTEPWFKLSPKSSITSEFRIVEQDMKVGETLNDWFPEGNRPSIGVLAAGGIAFAYDGVVWDLMGLNFVAMAHSEGDKKGPKNHAAFNKDVFWDTTPEIVMPFHSTGVEQLIEGRKKQLEKTVDTDPFKGLRNEERFLKEYALGVLDAGKGELIGGWFHREYLTKLEDMQFTEAEID